MVYLTNLNLNQNELQNAVIQPLATPPQNPKMGQVYTDSTTGHLKAFNGTEWVDLGNNITASLDLLVVDALPTEEISESTIYLVKQADETADGDIYDEYVYAGGAWERIGSTAVDLSDYLTKDGDASSLTVTFEQPEQYSAPQSGDTLATIAGKLSKLPAFPVATSCVIAAGETEVAAAITGKLLSYHAYDVVTGEEVMLDHIAGEQHTFSISVAWANDINIDIIYI